MQDVQNCKVLVTGGAGFIGSNLVKYLLDNGVQKVRVLDDFSTGHSRNITEFELDDRFELLEGDVRDAETCLKACDGMNYVLHQAALGSVPRSIIDPITSNEVNISGFLNMLWAVKEKGVERMIYAASSSTYGDSKGLPKVEHTIGKPLSPYAVTKYVNELYADVFAITYGVKTIGLRYFNVFGPKQDPNGAYAAVIPKFIDAVINDKQPIINGDGTISRDFTYIENVVEANIKAMLTETQEADNQVYNIACGDSTSLNELFALIVEIAEKKLTAIHGPERKGDIMYSLADISKAKTKLEYLPKIGVREGLHKTYQWFEMKKKNETV